MTVVRPNSIAGINSITVQTGQALNIHDASGNLIRNITSSTGISTFASVEITKGSGDLTVGVSTFFVDNSATNVGVGTNVPYNNAGTNVHIHSANTTSEIRFTNSTTGGGNNGGTIQQGGTTLYVSNSEAGNIAFENNGSERVRIDSSGQLVIGSTSGEAKLDVTGGVSISSNGVTVTPSGYDLKIRSNTSKLGIHCDSGSGTPTLEFGTGGSTGCFINDLDATPMRFGTHNTERMRIRGDGRVSIASSLAVTGVCTATGFYPTTAQTGRRNMFINGNMSIAQRSTSSSTNGYYSLDRFFTHWSGGAGTISQETLSPGDELEGSSHYLRMTVTTASDYTVMRCPLEDVRRFSGDITVSFWAKYVTNAPNGGLACWFQTNYGSGGTANGSTAQQTFNGSGLPSLTTSWVKYSVTFSDFPALSGKTIGAGNYAEFLFGQGATAGSTAFTLDITNIQVEKGESASAFEQIGHQENLAQCQRYYYKESIANNDFYSGMGMADVDGNSVILNLPFPVTMRQEPSLDTTGAATDYMIRRSTTAQCTSVPTIGGASTKHMAAVVFTKSSHGFGDGSAVRCGAWGNSYLGFDAELSI